MAKSINKKNIAKSKILNNMMINGSTSKVELAKNLNLSMPTVLSNVNELMELGIIMEDGEYESTGGRKARSIAINKAYRYAVGVNITANHVGMVMINLAGDIVRQERKRFSFSTDIQYYSELKEMLQQFIEAGAEADRILGVGFSLPGIINGTERILIKSHALQLENYSLKMLEQTTGYPVCFENDANAAMLAENPRSIENAVYLSLNNTLGGAICVDGRLCTGQNQKAGEFGHIILVPNGRACYCGKKGCADAYCAASALTENGTYTLEEFMARLGKDKKADVVWQDYLEMLAVLISNLRMAYDTDIILGGDVGGVLPAYHMKLGEMIFRYNLFDGDLSYLKYCTYTKEASAVGVAKHFFAEMIEAI